MSKGTAIFGMIVVFAIGFGVGYAIRGNVTMKAEKLTARGADADSKAKAGAQGKAKGLDAKAADAANPRYKVNLFAQTSPTKGPADAPVTIVEVSDFQCPYCSRAKRTVDALRKQYGDKIRLIWHNNPLSFHKRAMPAAIAALAAHEQGKFWEYHDKLWANQKALKRPDLERYAAELGLDLGKFKAALDSHKFAAQVKAETAEAETLGASGTPAFFINGIYLKGAKPFEEFKAVIDDELKKPARKPGAKIVPKMIPGGKGAPKVLKMAPRGPAKPTVKKAR